MSPARILIAAGGSGGHIFPAVAFVRTLGWMKRDVVVKFVGSSKALDRRILEKEGFNHSVLSANKLPYGVSLGYLSFIVKAIYDLIKALFITALFRPSVVIGFGGYISYPVVLAAAVFRIPVLIHEQNVMPGRANRALFRMADRIALSFGQTKGYMPPCDIEKSVVTGNPIRYESLKDDKDIGMKRFGLDKAKFTVLVIGGSQGAHSLNEIFVKAVSCLDERMKRTLQVIHLTGVKDYEWAAKEYGALGVENRIYSFIDRIEEAYSASDLIVTRAGASAIFEIAFFGRPMILVPYRYALGHQAANARIFTENRAAVVIDEARASAASFKETLVGLVNDRALLKELAENARRLSIPEASDKLADAALELAVRG